jgi:hypothetical protein
MGGKGGTAGSAAGAAGNSGGVAGAIGAGGIAGSGPGAGGAAGTGATAGAGVAGAPGTGGAAAGGAGGATAGSAGRGGTSGSAGSSGGNGGSSGAGGSTAGSAGRGGSGGSAGGGSGGAGRGGTGGGGTTGAGGGGGGGSGGAGRGGTTGGGGGSGGAGRGGTTGGGGGGSTGAGGGGTTGSAGRGGTGGAGGTPLAGLGASCSNANQCLSNYCVDGVCCNVACNLSCQGCSMATTGVSSGTCSIRSNQPAGTQVCSGACVNTQTNATHCNMCNHACSQPSLPNSVPACTAGVCGTACRSGYTMCHGTADSCVATGWDWETGDNMGWVPTSESPFMPSMDHPHLGQWSFEGIGSGVSSPGFAEVYASCDAPSTDYPVFDLRGKKVSAWVMLNGSFPAGTASCRLFADLVSGGSLNRTTLATNSNPLTTTWFSLSATLPSTGSQAFGIAVECTLPTDWNSSPTKRWYIDDVTIE